jgi:hypothetical protein
MNFAALWAALKNASLFDLWRLHAAIGRTLEDPRKNEDTRARLHVDQAVRYFDTRQNREVSGRIVEIMRRRALIRDDHDQKLWTIPFYMLNLQGVDLDSRFSPKHPKVCRDSLRVGDSVGYKTRSHHIVYAVVEKLNPKTATVRLTHGEQWNVSYSLLFNVLDAQTETIPTMLDGQIIPSQSQADAPLDAPGRD